MESEISIKKHLQVAKERYESGIGEYHTHYMYGWIKALSWVLGEEVTFDDL